MFTFSLPFFSLLILFSATTTTVQPYEATDRFLLDCGSPPMIPNRIGMVMKVLNLYLQTSPPPHFHSNLTSKVLGFLQLLIPLLEFSMLLPSLTRFLSPKDPNSSAYISILPPTQTLTQTNLSSLYHPMATLF